MTNMFLINDLIKEISVEALQVICSDRQSDQALRALKESSTMQHFVYCMLCRSNLQLAWKAVDGILGLEDLPKDIEESQLEIQNNIMDYIAKCIRDALPAEIAEAYLQVYADTEGYIGMIDAALDFGEKYIEVEFRMIW